MHKYFVKYVICFCLLLCTQEMNSTKFETLDKRYHLVSEAYHRAKTLFIQGRTQYDKLKERSLSTMDMFLDLVEILNEHMSQELRSAIVKYYKIKFLHDFNNYVINMEEIMDIIEHCLIGPTEKLAFVRNQFHNMIKNFEDVRNFDTVDKCHDELPDEVSAAHCILHQAVLFNETMQDSLVSIVEMKTKQHARDVNASLYEVPPCLNYFVPHFFNQLLVDSFSDNCEFMRVVNASMVDFTSDKWRNNFEALFPKKWGPLILTLKEKGKTQGIKYIQEHT
ncbi:unnamed protein product [Leptidea sinapis]|uniref:Uncharacterized protein n=1 Tax=Leptidea sinapis TaxID=189913 RepID=A0A5E4QGC0_9NEOP|nr:unnamed protein product [Leptidea sinapis]